MDDYKFSKEADRDIDSIYEYTILNFGILQAQEYLQNIYDKIKLLSSRMI